MLSLLIVEDEKSIAHLMKDILTPYFEHIYLAKDGASGLIKFKKLRPDIVICDVLMPLKDGLSLAKNIKDLSANTPVIIISAHSDKEKLLKAIDVNVNKYLIKPIIPEELIKSVKSIIKNLSQIRQIGKYQVDFTKSAFIVGDKHIELSKKELALLKSLSDPIGKVLSIDEIKQLCWANEGTKDGSVRTFIKRFRDKLGVDIIKNITSTGYKIALEES